MFDEEIELESKYVFHIPLHKYEDGKLVLIEIEDVLDDLIAQFHQKGFDGLYMTKVKSMYKARLYDEILITVFTTPQKSPLGIFKDWFRKNNHILAQEALAYENDGKLTIEKLG